MRSGEDSDQIAFALQWDGDFGARVRLAGDVVRVASDVGGVVHFACGGDVPDHSLAYLEAMTLAVNTAAANSGQYKARLLGIVQVDVDLDAAERSPNLIGDPRNQFFNVQSGGNPLCELLQTHQFREPLRGCFWERRGGEAEVRKRSGGHDETFLPIDCNCLMRLQK